MKLLVVFKGLNTTIISYTCVIRRQGQIDTTYHIHFVYLLSQQTAVYQFIVLYLIIITRTKRITLCLIFLVSHDMAVLL